MEYVKKLGIFKVLLLVVPFLLLPVFSFFFRIFEDNTSRFSGVSASFSAGSGEFQKTVYNIFFIFAFLCCLPISCIFKKCISAEKQRAVRSAYIAIFLLYNALFIPILMYFL